MVFGMEIGFKFATKQLIYLLNPCHVTTAIQVYDIERIKRCFLSLSSMLPNSPPPLPSVHLSWTLFSPLLLCISLSSFSFLSPFLFLVSLPFHIPCSCMYRKAMNLLSILFFGRSTNELLHYRFIFLLPRLVSLLLLYFEFISTSSMGLSSLYYSQSPTLVW